MSGTVPAAPAAPAANDVEAPKGPVTSVSYAFTSVTYNGKYKPRNVGAIWVETPDGKLVKSLEVWSWLRSRYLERYAQARNGALVDVTSSATLSRHGPHMASWDLLDVGGTKAAPGKYLLWFEISEDDGPGKSSSVELDTSKGPTTIDVPDSSGLSALKVQLH
jgi:hypothetical protein